MTSRRSPRAVQISVDANGCRMATVPLASSGAFAILDAEDYETLMAAGVSSRRQLNRSQSGNAYVRCRNPFVANGLVSVSRIIMCPPHGQVVRHKDGNRTNLRRHKLYLKEGHAFGDTAQAMKAAIAQAEVREQDPALLTTFAFGAPSVPLRAHHLLTASSAAETVSRVPPTHSDCV
jgi:hypothetical protein